MRTKYQFSDPMVETLKRLWNVEGLSAAQCGVEMSIKYPDYLGSLSRNAILGFMHRNQSMFMHRAKVIDPEVRAQRQRAAQERKVKHALLVRKIEERKAALRAAEDALHAKLEVVSPGIEQFADAFAPIDDRPPVPTLKLRKHHCRWPVGESPWMHCGAPIMLEGKPYCMTHYVFAHTHRTSREA